METLTHYGFERGPVELNKVCFHVLYQPAKDPDPVQDHAADRSGDPRGKPGKNRWALCERA